MSDSDPDCYILTEKGFLPHGIMVAPGSRIGFDFLHPCPCYPSVAIASFCALASAYTQRVRVVLLAENTIISALADMTVRHTPLARFASYIEVIEQPIATRDWTVRQRMEAAVLALVEVHPQNSRWVRNVLRSGVPTAPHVEIGDEGTLKQLVVATLEASDRCAQATGTCNTGSLRGREGATRSLPTDRRRLCRRCTAQL